MLAIIQLGMSGYTKGRMRTVLVFTDESMSGIDLTAIILVAGRRNIVYVYRSQIHRTEIDNLSAQGRAIDAPRFQTDIKALLIGIDQGMLDERVGAVVYGIGIIGRDQGTAPSLAAAAGRPP